MTALDFTQAAVDADSLRQWFHDLRTNQTTE